MHQPAFLYDLARKQHAEDVRRADAWRRAHPAPRSNPARVDHRLLKSSRHRLARLVTLLIHPAHH